MSAITALLGMAICNLSTDDVNDILLGSLMSLKSHIGCLVRHVKTDHLLFESCIAHIPSLNKSTLKLKLVFVYVGNFPTIGALTVHNVSRKHAS
uniref:Uncharacterized protein n=1 Tax=Lactuca sativa TaxID=4236 RepID=A0A9R1XGM3_LACSA|nr:hypothetical protein LSAT_V11C400198170 [Lactuca sativa]